MEKLNDIDMIVLRLAAVGFLNKEIGPRIGKTEFDVQYYKTRITKKLGAENFHHCIFLYGQWVAEQQYKVQE